MLRKASTSKVAKLYLRANVQTNMLDHHYVIINPKFKRDLMSSLTGLNTFTKTHLNQHALETLSWFVESAPALFKLNHEISMGWWGLEQKVKEIYVGRKQYSDGSKEAKAVDDAYNNCMVPLQNYRKWCDQTFSGEVQKALHNATNAKILISDMGGFEGAAESLVQYNRLVHQYFTSIRERLIGFAEAITDEGAMQAAKELNPGGVGGFFKKLFRRASMTLASQLTDKVDAMQETLDAFGLSSLVPKLLAEGVQTYSKLQGAQYSYLYTMQKLSEKGEFFHSYVIRTPHGESPLDLAPLRMFVNHNGTPLQLFTRDGHISREDILDGAPLHVAHQHAQKMMAVIDHIVQ